MLPTPYTKFDYDKVYEPSEDSFLLLDCLESELKFLDEKLKGKLSVVCEIGPGSGIVTTFMIQNSIPSLNSSIYLAVDINPWALESTIDTAARNNCKGRYLDTIQCNLTDSLKANEVDLLVFNPPYVPAEEVPQIPESKGEIDNWLDLALLGGKDGMVITNKVLENLDSILSSNGVAYILFCARNKPEVITAEMKKTGNWKIELVETRKAGWEVLSVYRFERQH
ncbi:hypothetical protein TBLA_0A03860 [Henningerozyma blattae CBS 6284]|uniref:Methyltransferase small domain-containing protein n=1 Tax=Henningerozyma blattae (strain ATCC 34711 / CBS 6284 / DSM 70876 / NBRC 10599 / NRRL Y-10934 / UCD 77-7) TaxID=1071380 RepID=I2GVN2_HENB6|nr:hypothetical protein TBLA_0A03860 [Tetrapisispora blattae CBS 6284]CCH58184.1 hypothetical protein TBLA_0A03860 [Tetrapisispora blattae CBS 6284]